jgi:hypothetical protein
MVSVLCTCQVELFHEAFGVEAGIYEAVSIEFAVVNAKGAVLSGKPALVKFVKWPIFEDVSDEDINIEGAEV